MVAGHPGGADPGREMRGSGRRMRLSTSSTTIITSAVGIITAAGATTEVEDSVVGDIMVVADSAAAATTVSDQGVRADRTHGVPQLPGWPGATAGTY